MASGLKVCKLLRILGLAAALSGYSSWIVSARQHASGPLEAARSIPATDIPLIRLADAQALWAAPDSIFLDVRPAFDYEVGHIRGALNLPWEEVDRQLPALKPRLAAAGAVVVYCKSADCGQSYWAALRLRQEGLPQVKIYPEGWYEWQDQGLPGSRGRK